MAIKVAFHNLGCKVNSYETEAMLAGLKKRGFVEVPFEEGADVYVINTCTVTNIADRKSRQMLHRAKAMDPDAAVVAVGLIVALIIIIASCAGGSHSIKNADGVEIASDSSIHPNDSDAEQKINAMLQNNGLTGTNTGISYMQYYAKGNAAVQEEKLLSKASDQEKSTYRATMESQLNGAEAKLPSYRAASGVDDMVCVYVLLDADNSIIYQKVIK